MSSQPPTAETRPLVDAREPTPLLYEFAVTLGSSRWFALGKARALRDTAARIDEFGAKVGDLVGLTFADGVAEAEDDAGGEVAFDEERALEVEERREDAAAAVSELAEELRRDAYVQEVFAAGISRAFQTLCQLLGVAEADTERLLVRLVNTEAVSAGGLEAAVIGAHGSRPPERPTPRERPTHHDHPREDSP